MIYNLKVQSIDNIKNASKFLIKLCLFLLDHQRYVRFEVAMMEYNTLYLD